MKSSEFYNSIAHKYEDDYDAPYWKLYFDVTWEHIKKYLPRSKKYPILDAGGGTGFWSRKLASLGYSLVCSDVAINMLETGRKTVQNTSFAKRIRFVVSDLCNMKEFEDNSFSMVLAEGDPVGYCGNPAKAVKELARVARKESPIIVSVDSLFPIVGKIISSRKYKQLSHVLKTHISDFHGHFPQYNFTADELRKLYERNNISVSSIIGKTVFTRFLSVDKIDKLLAQPSFYKRILELELKFNSNPSLVGCAGHVEIAGFKG